MDMVLISPCRPFFLIEKGILSYTCVNVSPAGSYFSFHGIIFFWKGKRITGCHKLIALALKKNETAEIKEKLRAGQDQ